MSSSNEILTNFSGVIDQFRQENSSSSASDIFFESNSNNSKSNNSKSNICKQCKSVKVHPNFIPYCGPLCKDHYESKKKYELKGLLMKVGD